MPWVPRDLYELMLDALRQTGASAQPSVVAPTIAMATWPAAPVAPTTTEAVALPRPVLDACEQFAFGDPAERVLNVQRALELQAKGQSPRDIVAAIRAGANTEALFIG